MIITCPKCSAKYKVPSEISLKKGQKMQCSACQNIFKFQGEVSEVIPEKLPILPPEDAVLSVHSRTEKIVIHQPEKKEVPHEKAVLPEVFLPVQTPKKASPFPILGLGCCIVLLIVLAVIGWNYRKNLSMPHLPFIKKVYDSPVPKRPYKAEKPVSVAYSDDIPLFEEEEAKEKVLFKDNFSVQSVRFRKTPTADALLIEGTLKNISSESMMVPEKIYALGYGADGKVLFEKEIHLTSGILYPEAEQSFFGSYPLKGEEVQWVDVVLEK